MELIAPRVAASSSLGALAFAAFSPAGPAPDNVPEAQWLGAHREGRETWLEDLPAAFAAWLKDPPPEDRRLVALASAIGLTRAETLAVALSRAAETDAMAGRYSRGCRLRSAAPARWPDWSPAWQSASATRHR